MYGIWLFKEVKTPYGWAKVEILQKDYAGDAMEIETIAADSIVLSVSNLSEVASPLQKSQLSLSIVDTNQFDYSVFFTPDARKYMVVLSSRLEGGEYIRRWSGFLTPDSYTEELQYRSTIDLIARDNIGLLNDYQFDYIPADANNSVDSIRNIILAGFRKINDPYPMDVVFRTGKTTIGGTEQSPILVVDCMVNCYQMYGKTWGEVLEILLHDMGLQLRYIDNNTLAIYDLSQLSDLAGDAGQTDAFFISSSGVREMQPAWREFHVSQDYGVIDDFYIGDINGENKMIFVKTSSFSNNASLYEPVASTHWSRQGDIFVHNFYNQLNNFVDDNKAESIYFTGCSPEISDAVVSENKLIYSQQVHAIDKQINISFTLNDTLRTPCVSRTEFTRGETAPSIFYLPYQQINRVTYPLVYQLKYRFNVFLIGDDGETYVMREKWTKISDEQDEAFIEFTAEKLKTYYTSVITSGGSKAEKFTAYNNDKEYNIVINGIPVSGALQFVIYPYTFVNDSYTDVRDTSAYERGAKISNIAFKVETESKGVESKVTINAEHNIQADDSFMYGQVPQAQGDFLLYTGGLFYPDTLIAANGFKLAGQQDAQARHLLELVSREIIHYNKTNYTALSGQCQEPNRQPLMFSHHMVREGQKYILLTASLNIVSNTINITRMTEIQPYEDTELTHINSPVSTGSSSVTGGSNLILQFSDKAGNAKRIYELAEASNSELNNVFVMVDRDGYNEAKKVSMARVLEVANWFELRTLSDGSKVLVTPYHFASMGEVTAGGVSEDVTSAILMQKIEELQAEINQIKAQINEQ